MPESRKRCGHCLYGRTLVSDENDRQTPVIGDLFCVVDPPQPTVFTVGAVPRRVFPRDTQAMVVREWGFPEVSKDATCGRFSPSDLGTGE